MDSADRLAFHAGISVPDLPSLIRQNQNSGAMPAAMGLVRSRGLGFIDAPAAPSPLPAAPWQKTQFASKISFPLAMASAFFRSNGGLFPP